MFRLIGLFLLLQLLLITTPSNAQGNPPAPGFPNVTQVPGTVLSGLNAPEQGRTAIIAYHSGLLFTVPELPSSQPNSDFQVRSWDISDPTQPAVIDMYGISPMPINAHGYIKSGDYLVIGPNWPPEAPWAFRADGDGSVLRTEFPYNDGVGVRGQLFQPWFAGATYWSYNEVGGTTELALRGEVLAEWDHLALTGVIGHPFLIGDLLIFASDQSRTGVATYSVADPANPVLLDVVTTGGAGGYWPEIWGGNGKLYVVFPYRSNGNGFRVVDATDPTDLRFVADQPLPGDEAMYAQFQDEYAFIGDHKIDLRTFESVLFLDGANAVRPNDGGTGISTSQFALPLGNLLVTGGVGPNQGMAIWAHQAEPDTRGPYVGFHIPQAGRTNYPLTAPISLLIHETLETTTVVNGSTFIVRPLGGNAIDGRLTFAFDDILTFTPDQPLQANTTYEVVLADGGIEDAAGNGMSGYAFTFSTGSSVGGNLPPTVDSFSASLYPAAPAQSITLSATGTDPEAGALEYRFDFGDGSPSTTWSATASATQAYAASGHYRAVVQVRDAAGALASAQTTVTVTVPAPGPRPTHSTAIACDDASRRVFKVNPDNDTVTAFDADSLEVVYEVPACGDPRSVALSSQGELWISCFDNDRIQILDATSGAPLMQLPLGYGSAPQGIAISADGNTAFVALQGAGELRRFDTVNHQQTGSLDLAPTPRAVAITGDGASVFVSRFMSAKDHPEVWQVDAAANTLSRTLRIEKFGDAENRDGTAAGRGVANYLVGLAISPDDASLWLASNKPNSERGLFFAQDLDQDNTVRNMFSQLDLGRGLMIDAIDLDNSDSASSIAFSPLGDYLLVGLQGTNDVIVLDALRVGSVNGLGSLTTRLGVGLAPQGLCVDDSTGRTFSSNFMDRSITTLNTDDLFRYGTKVVASTAIAAVASESLSPEILNGKQIFYNAGDERMSAEGYISCATCHLDGGQDGRVWDFTGRGEGFRNTTSLRGRSGTGHGNVHWTANFDEIQDFENDIRGPFGGNGLMSDSDFAATSDPLGPPKAGLSTDLDALAAYVTSLGQQSLPRSPFRDASGGLTATGEAGANVFASQGCASCNAGERMTDSAVGTAVLHDVGTLRTSSGGRLGGPLPGIDTPTLRGAWNTAPYFHDGSAQTLGDVFVVAGGEMLQAEAATPSGGASIIDQYVDLNNDDTVHGRAFAALNNSGSTITWSGIEGGSGGIGAVEIRYSTSSPTDLEVRVNGSPLNITLAPAANDPGWRHTNWLQHRLEDVAWNAGTANSLELSLPGFGNLSIDDVVITTADELSLATPHRQVLDLPSGQQQELLAFLLQLDGSPLEADAGLLFRDGFETGNTAAWVTTVNP